MNATNKNHSPPTWKWNESKIPENYPSHKYSPFFEKIPSESKFWTLMWLLCLDLSEQEFEVEAIGCLCSHNGDY